MKSTPSERAPIAPQVTSDWLAATRGVDIVFATDPETARVSLPFVAGSTHACAWPTSPRPRAVGQPRPGDAYRQEYYPPGEALDRARVLKLDAALTVPAGRFRHVLVTSAYSPAEPQSEHKYYAAGVGEIAERVVKGGREESSWWPSATRRCGCGARSSV